MNFLQEDHYSNEWGIDLTRSKQGNHSDHKVDLRNAHGDAWVPKRHDPDDPRRFVGVGRCVVHQLPIHHFPSTVKVSSGDPKEIFAGFVFKSGEFGRLPEDVVVVTGGFFHLYTMHYDPKCSFALRGTVYAGPQGLLVSEPGAEVGVVTSIPCVKDPWLGVMGYAQG